MTLVMHAAVETVQLRWFDCQLRAGTGRANRTDKISTAGGLMVVHHCGDMGAQGVLLVTSKWFSVKQRPTIFWAARSNMNGRKERKAVQPQL